MDPDATLELIMNAIDRDDPEEAKSLIAELVSWLSKDGFVPSVTRSQLMTLLAHTSLAMQLAGDMQEKH
jgi:hypothetical protein